MPLQTYRASATLAAAALVCSAPPGAANPVEVPYANDFSRDAADFFCPTGNGYNWGHDWRRENFQTWVTAANRTASGTMEARQLAGRDFLMRVRVEPVEVGGAGASVGFAAAGSDRELLRSFYLADVKPPENRVRILRVSASGGNRTIAAERDLAEVATGGGGPFELEFRGSYADGTVRLDLTVRQGGREETVGGTDPDPLAGRHFGLRARSGGGGSRFEHHFDDFELRPAHLLTVVAAPPALAPVGAFYTGSLAALADPPGAVAIEGEVVPPWAALVGGVLSGTPGPADVGVHPLVLTARSGGAGATVRQTVTVPEPSAVVISEFMAENEAALADEEGDYPDWIELFNPGAEPADLGGWSLTDDPAEPGKWLIPPGTVIPPAGFRVFFASGKELPGHAGFALDNAGGYLALVDPDGAVADVFEAYPRQRADLAFGRFGDYARAGYLPTPTPGAPNPEAGFEGLVADTVFSVDRGFFDGPFLAEITCATPGASIAYTTDGSTPSETNGVVVAPPDAGGTPAARVTVAGTTVLRARAILPRHLPSNVDTQTYLFLGDIRTQNADGAAPPGWPRGSVNGQAVNYGMDPDVTGALAGGEFEAAMTDIATLSLVTDLGNLFDPEEGIWVNAENRGPGWERPVSVELLHPDGAPGFQIDAGARIRGGWSRRGENPKHAFHLYFKRRYGDAKLRFPLFGEEGTDTFDRLDLRCAQGRSWHFSASADATFNRDVFARHLQRDMGQLYSRSRYYHCYINGVYTGLFQSQERVDKFFAAAYFGGAPGDYDVIKTRTRPHRVEALDGDPEAWSRLYDAAVAGFADDAAYFAVQGLGPGGAPDPAGENLVDVDNLIDYLLAIFYTGQTDGPVNLGANVPKNFFALRPRDGRTGFRFFVHDNEDSLQGVGADATRSNPTGERLTHFNPKWLHQRLAENPRYRRRFGDRAHRHLFNGGALTAESCTATFLESADQIARAVVGESARWGDYRTNPPYGQSHWQGAVDGKVNTWIPQRGDILLGQLRGRGLYPDIGAPEFNPHGGQVAAGTRVSLAAGAGAEVYYTLDGSDPADPGAPRLVDGVAGGGGAAEVLLPAGAEAWRFRVTANGLGNSEVVVGSPSYWIGDWKHPRFNDDSWVLGVAPLGFGEVGDPPVATEVPSSGGEGAGSYPTTYFRRRFDIPSDPAEGRFTLRLRSDDGALAYLNGREVARWNLPTGVVAYGTLASRSASGADESSFQSFLLDPAALVQGENVLAVEVHQATTSSGDLVLDAEVTRIDGAAPGVLIETSATLRTRALKDGEWSALTQAAFFTTAPAAAGNVRVSEIFYNPSGGGEALEYIELVNVGAETVHLDGAAFDRGIAFTFPPGTELSPGAYLLVVRDPAAFEAAFGAGLPVVGTYDGKLSNGGEEIRLTAADGASITAFSYGDEQPWSSLPDGGGHSLVFVGGNPDEPGSWRASAAAGGYPGGDDGLAFTGDPGDDDDGDGTPNLIQYALGGPARSEVSLDHRGGRAVLAIALTRNLAADDTEVSLEVSPDLVTWSAAGPDLVRVGETLAAPGVALHRYELAVPAGADAARARFIRLRVRLRPGSR